jgi:hypothetical protein
MSEHTRDVFRTALVAATSLPYYETVAKGFDLNMAPDLWVSLEFPLVTAARTTIGYPACYRETGTVFVHVVGRSGQGDAAPIHEAELIRSYFDAPFVDDVRMLTTMPPTLAPTDAGEWIDVVLAIDYEWDYVVAGPAVARRPDPTQPQEVTP